MKKIILYSALPFFAFFLFVAAQKNTAMPGCQEENGLNIPENVMGLLERSCFDCHTKEAGNAKAKLALNFDKWEAYKLSKQIGKLNDISQEVKEQKMPPSKYLNKYPEKALSEEEMKTIVDWANGEADKLLEE